MKKVAIAACIVTIALVLLSGLAKAQHTFRTTPTGTVIGYLEYLPPDYNTNSNKYPVVIFLHGVKERGANSTDPATLKTTINLVTALGPPMHVKNGASMPFILITPQLKNSYSSWPASYVKEVLDHCKTYLRIDERRIHITGLSMGGHGAWTCLQEMATTYASGAPVCGAHNSPSLACNIARENVAVWAFHGDKDDVVPYSKTVNMVNAINACTPAPNPLAKASIYAGVRHEAWYRAYYLDNTYHNPNFYQWVMQQSKSKKAGNNIPLANAGGDKSISLPTNSVAITGTASDNGGSIASYRWSQLQGPSTATLTNSTSATVTASNLVSGTYVFKFTVTDNGGVIDSDFVKVTVSGTGSNTPPVVNAGSDKTLHLPTNSTSIAASASDSDGISTYSWSKVSGGNATLAGNTSNTLSVTGMAAGSYVFRVTATDTKGAANSDDVAVVVNNPPTVSAGADLTIALPTNSVSIQGSASDSDGSISTYAWTKTSGSSATLSGATTSKLTASGLVAGSYIFRLTVTDNRGATKYDDVNVTVSASTTNLVPVANAGADKVITLPTSSVSFAGSATDSDGTIASYRWTKMSGGNATLSNATSATLSVSGLAAGAYIFRLTVTDDKGATDIDDVSLFVNNAPNVNAGVDKVISLPSSSASFTATATDADGTISSYNWRKLAGGNATLTGATTGTLSVSGLVAGSYIFRVTVTDDKGATDIDDVNLIVNNPPSVNAGADYSITLPTNSTSIQGSASDSDGTIATYAWSKISGSSATLSGTGTSKLTASGLVAGSYVFRLTVTDNHGASKYDDIKLTVNTSSGSTTPNSVPVANAGADRVITLPTNTISLTGGGTDSDGTISSYSWAKISGSTATLTGANTNTVSVSALVAGTYYFRLTVTDDDGATDIDDVIVVVNVPPTVSAGSDLTITLPTNSASVQGTASDADGTIASYAWSKISGSSATLSGTSTSKLTASGLVAGSYVFRLTVTDNRGGSKYDDVTVTVKSSSGESTTSNSVPVANAGADRVITLPINLLTLTGGGTDSDGTITSYSWAKISGGAATLSGANTNTLSASGLSAGTYFFRLTVTDDDGATDIDDVIVTVNVPPTVSVGSDLTITLPTNSVSVQGTASDTDGSITSYQWRMITGSIATLSNTTTSKLTVTGLVEGSYVFRLVVKDNHGATQRDDIKVVVNGAADNVAPTANAGVDKVVTLPTSSITLTGSGSDSDGTISQYNWTQIAGNAATLSGTSTSSLAVSGLVSGNYLFRLLVVDNKGRTDIDDVAVVVNTPPSVSVGADYTITLPVNSTSVQATASDVDGTIASYNWVMTSGSAATLSGTTTSKLTASGLTAGSYVFRLTVRDNLGATSFDDVKITVNGATSGAAIASSTEVIEGETLLEDSSERDLLYDNKSYWMSRNVVIYDAGGKQIFKGKWSPELYKEIIEPGKLFIYNVIDDARRVKQGKVFVTR